MRTENYASAMARFVTEPPTIDGELVSRAKAHFVETLGVTWAGTNERSVQALLNCAAIVSETSAAARSLVSSKRMSIRDAAACNSVAGHVHDFDDDEPHVIVGHPSVAVVGALSALADYNHLSYERALRAYLLGTEAMLRLGALVNPQHYNAGWHCTASLGVVGTAAACASAMRLTGDQTRNALNISVTFAGGMKENFGTDGKPLQVGAAAANGLWACELAAAGLQGSDTAITGDQGFIAMNGGLHRALDLDTWGRPWAIENPGFNVKIYPCCSSTHTALDAILELLVETGWDAEQVEGIDVWVGADVPKILIHDTPRSGLEGKFSMRYCLARAVVHRAVDLSAFVDSAVADEAVAAMMTRTRLHIDANLPRASTGVTHRSRVRVTSKSSGQVERSHCAPRGSAERPCSEEEMRGKFLAAVAHGLGPDKALQVWNCAESMSHTDRVSRLLDAIHAERTA